ncbi:hypothetical protein C9374_005135 [Naegleria lovaniensis]|uniref:Uncharacterized protein n=1 Tax=Naegleria lovaniensis TaxID=51637 RepID=A0AA88GLR4_NAELO|nr:uncharacterized protein C9374_005135 [Naegleria lovaniensis]KAG2382555.1 hypothetical protein C9374_005135 [Naegleria lovaniensis]
MSSCFTRASCWALILCVFYWVLVIIHVVKASPSSSSVAPPNSSIPENRSAVGLTTQSNTTAIMNDDQRHAFLKRCLESNLYFYPLRSSLNSSTHNSEAECCFRLARNHLYNQVIEDFEKISPNKTKLHYPASFTQISSSLKTCHGIIDTNDSHQKQWIQGNFSQLFKSMSTSQLWNIASAEAVNVQEGMGNFPIETYLACDGNFTCISNAIKLCASHIVFTHVLKVRHNETNRDIGKEIIGAYYNQVIESWGIQSTENRDGKMNNQTLAQLLWHSCSEPGTKELVLLSPKQVPFVFAPILFIGIVTLLLIQQCNFSDHPVEMTSDICENLDPTTTMDVPGSTTSDHSSTSQATDKDPASTDNQDLANNDTTHSETNKQECKTSVSDETSTMKKPAGEIQPTSTCHQSETSSSVDPQTPTESSLKQESNVQSNILVSDEANTEKSTEEIQQTNTSASQLAITQKDTQDSSFNENDHNTSQTTDLNNSTPSLSTSSSQQTESYGEVSMESHQEVKSEKSDKEMEDGSPLDGSSTDLQGKEQEETSTRTTCETCLNIVLDNSTHNTECEKAENNTLSETPISPHSTILPQHPKSFWRGNRCLLRLQF